MNYILIDYFIRPLLQPSQVDGLNHAVCPFSSLVFRILVVGSVSGFTVSSPVEAVLVSL